MLLMSLSFRVLRQRTAILPLSVKMVRMSERLKTTAVPLRNSFLLGGGLTSYATGKSTRIQKWSVFTSGGDQ